MRTISTAFYIVIAILVFSVLIVVHELGHFLCAKWSNVKVNEFSIGMGPVLLKHKKKETQYSLRLFPIGGFVSMEGEDKDSDDERAFNRISVWKRILIVIAGAVMNIVLGFIIVIIIFSVSSGIGSTTVAKFDDKAVSVKSGLKAGDRIESINGSKVNIDTDIAYDLMQIRSGTVDVVVKRNNQSVELKSVQFPLVSDGNGGKVMSRDFYVYAQHKNVLSVLHYSFFWTIATVKLVWMTLIDMFKGIYSVKDLSGPVGVSVAMGQAASQGVLSLLIVTALITINLGVVNLLPIPALDGGRLVFLLIEAVRRKPMKPEVEGYIHFAGFVLLMLLVVVVTYNDLARLNVFKLVGGLFR